MSAAGPSQLPPPHELMKAGDRAAVNQARLRLSPKRSFLNRLFKRKGTQRYPDRQEPESNLPSDQEIQQFQSLGEPDEAYEPHFVRIEDSYLVDTALEENYDKDVYRWAILYENQRGAMFFSTPYYSDQSLLPMDPPPFTIPSASLSPRKGQPTVSLSSYPLPDGSWRWVSRTWMVDMRGDGQTQYDGFEYNWFFRAKKWRAEVGNFNAGGWVRRRRWVRLMMRPARQAHVKGEPESGKSTPGDIPHVSHIESGATRPPSVIAPISSECTSLVEIEVWTGEGEEDWVRCRTALRKLGRDGRKLEIWRCWLLTAEVPRASHTDVSGDEEKGKQPQRQWSEDEHLLPSHSTPYEDDKLAEDTSVSTGRAPREHVAAVIRNHGTEIIQSFVYPDSRAQFLEILARADLLSQLHVCARKSTGLQVLDFWSYSSSLDDLSNLVNKE